MGNSIKNLFLEFSLSNRILLGIMIGMLLFYIPISILSIRRQKNYKNLFGLGLRKVRYELSIFDIKKYILDFRYIKNKNKWLRQHNKAVENVKFDLLINHYGSNKGIIKRKGVW